MAAYSAIEWTDATWNPITGCSITSPGCTNCYAMKLAGTRLRHHPSREGLTRDSNGGPVWTGEVRLNEAALEHPMQWRRPRRIFVCAHGDLFHESVPEEWLASVFNVMADCPQHTFQVLTKRDARMHAVMDGPKHHRLWSHKLWHRNELPNVWFGVSVEDRRNTTRIDRLRETPAAKRFLSLEPLLEDLGAIDLTDIDWVIVGGESGPNARPVHPAWVRSIRDQCIAAGVPFFFKQWGEWIDADHWLDKITAGPGKVMAGDQPWQPARPLSFADAETMARVTGRATYRHESDGTTLIRVGKHAAGAALDGRGWRQMPEARA